MCLTFVYLLVKYYVLIVVYFFLYNNLIDLILLDLHRINIC